LLRSLQEIQPDFEEEAKAYAGLWNQGKEKKKIRSRRMLICGLCITHGKGEKCTQNFGRENLKEVATRKTRRG
jgi:hypothetical protein